MYAIIPEFSGRKPKHSLFIRTKILPLASQARKTRAVNPMPPTVNASAFHCL
jgi:hypothetical protein